MGEILLQSLPIPLKNTWEKIGDSRSHGPPWECIEEITSKKRGSFYRFLKGAALMGLSFTADNNSAFHLLDSPKFSRHAGLDPASRTFKLLK